MNIDRTFSKKPQQISEYSCLSYLRFSQLLNDTSCVSAIFKVVPSQVKFNNFFLSGKVSIYLYTIYWIRLNCIINDNLYNKKRARVRQKIRFTTCPVDIISVNMDRKRVAWLFISAINRCTIMLFFKLKKTC